MACEHVPRAGDFETEIPAEYVDDELQQHLDRWWRVHVIVSAVPLYALGGLPWVVWGMGMRIATSIVGHWLVNYLAHTSGDQPWTVDGAGEQGRNYRLLGALSMGEGWHNNHHAFPRSAQLVLERLGLVWDVYDAKRAGLRPGAHATGSFDGS